MAIARLLILFLLVTFPAAALHGQGPDADWNTIETEHFRFHFPREFETWTREAAGKMETIRTRLIDEIGYVPAGKTDVLIMDPRAQANGSAWPFLGAPRMVLWTNPPGPETTLGNFSNWIDVVAVHEEAHLVHLLRPSRNPLQRIAEVLLPVGPIGLRAPRWVSEGYATVLEGELTGTGRPNSDFRASILRRWAQLGRLPSYGQLRSDSESWLGMSMAYLAGSSYLEWLREREGPDSLRHLWARLTARHPRGFDEAFEGVFGDAPRKLYDRYTAELTHAALEIEKQRQATLREGELWQDLRWSTEPPAVSSDGGRLLTVLRSREDPSELVVYSTAAPEEETRRYEELREKRAALDPEDVRPVLRKPLRREPLHRLRSERRDEDFEGPRWMPDGRSILFSRFEPDSRGVLHPDLYVWSFGNGTLDRVTRGADVRDADPLPDGTAAIAVRNRHGFSQLVRVDLRSAAIEELTPPSVETIYTYPRVSPDGTRLAFVRHQEARWNLIVRDLRSGDERVLDVAGATMVMQPAWSSDGESIFLSAGRGGFIEVHQVPLDGAVAREVTRTHGAAFAPAPSGDALYFLSLEADGFDIRKLDLAQAAGPLPAFTVDPERWPLAGSRTSVPVIIPVANVGPARGYGAGRQEFSLLFGGIRAEGSDAVEIGARIGDVVGRLDTLVVASVADRGVSGGALAAAWRGFPVALSAHLFDADVRGAAQGLLLEDRQGIELAGDWRAATRARRTALAGGLFAARAGEADEQGLFAAFGHDAELPTGAWTFSGSIDAELFHGWRDGRTWERGRAGAGGRAALGDVGVLVGYTRGQSSGDPGEVPFALGGVGSTILPRSATSGRVHDPALEPATLIGERFESVSADLQAGDFPLSAFYQRHRFWSDSVRKGDWFDLAGLRLSLTLDPFPLLQLPGLEIQLGAAQVLSEPFDGSTRWWLGVSYRP